MTFFSTDRALLPKDASQDLTQAERTQQQVQLQFASAVHGAGS